MDVLGEVAELPARSGGTRPAEARSDPGGEAPAPSAIAYLRDADSEGVIRRSLGDLGLVDGTVGQGTVDTAIESLAQGTWPRLLIVDISGIDDPLARINHLAETCNPSTEVIVVGDRNDIVLYRDLKEAGVAEYFFKPLVSGVVNRTLAAIVTGGRGPAVPRTGRLVTVIGTRGGVGATTIAVNAAWHIAMTHGRHAMILDLDLQGGDAALQLDAQPHHALREALEQPSRIDDLFLERGVTNVTPRLALLGALESLSGPVDLNEEAVMQLIDKLLRRYRYVFIDLPRAAALSLPKLLHLPGIVLLVGTGSLACARDLLRWREKIGPNTPERSLLHVLNKKGAEDTLPAAELLRALGQEPDVAIAYGRDVAAATNLGVKATQRCGAIRYGMTELARHLAGAAAEQPPTLWHRVFG